MVVLVVSASLVIAGAAESGPPVAALSDASQIPVAFFLPNFIREDPTGRLTVAAELSPEQQAHVHACYEQYRREALDLGDQARDVVEREGHWANKLRMGNEAPIEVRRASAQSFQRARDLVRSRYLLIEQAFLDGAVTCVADGQHAQFRREGLMIQRESWLELGAGAPQDFYQFEDPIGMLLGEVEHARLATHSFELFDAMVRGWEEHLASTLPRQRCSFTASLQSLNIARTDPRPEARALALRRFIRDWRRLYDTLAQVIEEGSVFFESNGAAQSARRVREEFWAVCFPDLVGAELTPALLEAAAKTVDPQDADMRAVLGELSESYFRGRHLLLRQAVTHHLRDYMDIVDEMERRERITQPTLGTSSTEVTRVQIARCDLALETQRRLSEVIGESQRSTVMWARPERLAFDTTRTRQLLLDALREFELASAKRGEQ